jgi:hypothetical protein
LDRSRMTHFATRMGWCFCPFSRPIIC